MCFKTIITFTSEDDPQHQDFCGHSRAYYRHRQSYNPWKGQCNTWTLETLAVQCCCSKTCCKNKYEKAMKECLRIEEQGLGSQTDVNGGEQLQKLDLPGAKPTSEEDVDMLDGMDTLHKGWIHRRDVLHKNCKAAWQHWMAVMGVPDVEADWERT